MNRPPNVRPLIAILLAGGIGLPVVICVVSGVGMMLAAMGDLAGGAVLKWIGASFAVLWVIDLVLLILLQGLHFLFGDSKDGDNGAEP
jgi:hypothetical protein